MDERITELLSKMTIAEKVGQMSQLNGFNGQIPDDFREKVQQGFVGSVLNEVDTDTLNELQRIAVEESRLGIPLLIGRDVIHGFKTILPIPLGQAASWNRDLLEKGARVAAVEARSVGINWTFAPMIDITRDPRWGRIAESLGEDPYLTSQLGAAMVRGFQGIDLSEKGRIAACAKHFAAYGAAEGGRDYNTTTIPENELRDVYLPPFKTCIDTGVATVMAAFNEINGVPATGDEFLLRQVLRDEWAFSGFVVSDWESVSQQVEHGFTENNKAAARQAITAGVDMEMAGTTYADFVAALIAEGKLKEELLDEAVSRILKIKFQLGLFQNPFTDPAEFPVILNGEHRNIAQISAEQSVVLLKNKQQILPLSGDKNVAVIGPLADAPYDQLGTWIFDGDKRNSITPLQAIKEYSKNNFDVLYAPGLELSRTNDHSGFEDAVEIAKRSDIILLFLGEESILSGESHCRANIDLPGAQEALVEKLAATGKAIVAVIMAGRPLTFRNIIDKVDGLLYAWHPGTMAGPAICNLVFGECVPSAKLPVTFPTVAGQMPMYYSHKNTGKPATNKTWERMNDIPAEAFQLSIGNTSHYLDEGFEPLFPFGFGLSYTSFEYSNLELSSEKVKMGSPLQVSVELTNTGNYDGEEVVQLYVRDLFGDRTRPVRELKGFEKVKLKQGQQKKILFTLETADLAFHNRKMELVTEAGKFRVWVGGSSRAELGAGFEIFE